MYNMPFVETPQISEPNMQITSQEEQVLEANQHFYTAVQEMSVEQMEAIWLQEPYVRCLHPGWNILEGWETIRESWQQIFEESSFMRVVIGVQSVRVEENIAWVCCTEKISTVGENRFESTYIQSTNLFEQRGGGWYIVHHHASPMPAPWPQEPGNDFVH
jgi:ketosteroid isomerase-like protein